MKCDCKSWDGHDEWCSRHPMNIVNEENSELLGEIENLIKENNKLKEMIVNVSGFDIISRVLILYTLCMTALLLIIIFYHVK